MPEGDLDVYDLKRKYNGYAVIINNLHLEMKATHNDVSNLQKVFDKVKNWSSAKN